MENIFTRLADERKRLGLNKGQMAKAGNVANSTYANYEDGSRSPDGEFFSAIAAAGADVLYILTGDIDSQALSADEQELIAAFRAAPLAVKGAVIGALSAGANPPGPPRIKQKVSGTGHQLAGRDVVNHQGVDIDVQGEARNRRK